MCMGERCRYYIRSVTLTGRKSVHGRALALLYTFCGTHWEEECACDDKACSVLLFFNLLCGPEGQEC